MTSLWSADYKWEIPQLFYNETLSYHFDRETSVKMKLCLRYRVLIGSMVPVFENRQKMLYHSTLLCSRHLRGLAILALGDPHFSNVKMQKLK